MNSEPNVPSWEFAKAFRVPETLRAPIVTWDGAQDLAAGLQQLGKAEREDIPKLLQSWSERLCDLGGDPSSHEWNKFRPLRLRREEDWSDWLAYLIEESKSGIFAYYLFGNSDAAQPADWAAPDVNREESTEEDHRADLVIHWSNHKGSQVEIKVGDEHLDKTYDTCEELHRQFPSTLWEDYIVLPEDSLDAWEETEANHATGFSFKIRPLTWYQVAIALRRALWSRTESLTWLAWAYAYCGAIERRLLKIKPSAKTGWWTASSDILCCELLREGQIPTGGTNEKG